MCRRTADSEASDGKQAENIPTGEERKAASLIQKFLQQTAATVATFKVNLVFLEDNTGPSSPAKNTAPHLKSSNETLPGANVCLKSRKRNVKYLLVALG